ncbi:MAG TPA: thioredoxin domain-containing protein [Hyphomicrobiaceae bacterium]|nr:thioredoxin domain-containing protein [Hyphomicrobiaceae bacterium]
MPILPPRGTGSGGKGSGGIDRRLMIGAAIAVAGLAAVQLYPRLTSTSPRASVLGDRVSLDQLMAPGPLPDLMWGKPEAPVTIVEFASMTCGHCGEFHKLVWPKLEEKYIRTGKARLILREYPIDQLALFAAMLGRCAGPEKGRELIGEMFKAQSTWAVGETGKPAAELTKLWEAQGLPKAEFQACAEKTDLMGQLTAARSRAKSVFAIKGTPTFFVNGYRVTGPTDTIDTFDAAFAEIAKR